MLLPGGEFKLLKPPVIVPCVRIQQDPGKPPIIVQCLKIQQDCRQRGKISGIEAESFFAMYQNTTRLQATGENLSH